MGPHACSAAQTQCSHVCSSPTAAGPLLKPLLPPPAPLLQLATHRFFPPAFKALVRTLLLAHHRLRCSPAWALADACPADAMHAAAQRRSASLAAAAAAKQAAAAAANPFAASAFQTCAAQVRVRAGHAWAGPWPLVTAAARCCVCTCPACAQPALPQPPSLTAPCAPPSPAG